MTTIKRIDPHIERIKRNRLHPRHHDVLQQDSEIGLPSYIGPNGIVRKNPHSVGFIGPNGIKRIDRTNLNQSSAQTQNRAQDQEQKPLHRIEAPSSYLVVIPDLSAGRLSSHDKDVIGFARSLADSEQGQEANLAVIAITFGQHKEQSWQDSGVDRLLELNSDVYDGYCPETQVAALATLDSQIHVTHFLFPDSIDSGADIGRRLAAKLQVRPVTHGWKSQEDSIRCRAGAGTLDLVKTTSKIMLLDAEIADPVDEMRYEASAPDLSSEMLPNSDQAPSSLQDQGLLAVDPADISLAEAPFILSGGNGIRDWQTFHDAATLLGATEGASRVAVDDGFMPRHRQVGATGTWVTARVYIAVGISGAVQHLQGIAQVDKVVAINTNPSCDMVKRADLSIIADSTDILTALIQAVKATDDSLGENSHAA